MCSSGVTEVTHFRKDGRNDNNRSTIISVDLNTFILNLNKSTNNSFKKVEKLKHIEHTLLE